VGDGWGASVPEQDPQEDAAAAWIAATLRIFRKAAHQIAVTVDVGG